MRKFGSCNWLASSSDPTDKACATQTPFASHLIIKLNLNHDAWERNSTGYKDADRYGVRSPEENPYELLEKKIFQRG